MSGNPAATQMQLVLDPWLEATRTLEMERADHPGFADIRHLLGLLYLAQADPEPAVAEFDAALAANPHFRRARFCRCMAMRRRDGSLDPAAWGEASLLDGESEPERSLWTAWFLGQSGDRDGAREVLRRLSEMLPWKALAFYVLSVYERGWGNLPAATSALASSAAAHPQYKSVLEGRGLINGVRKKPAVPPFEPVLQDQAAETWNPVAADLCHYFGTLCARHGQLDEARTYYEEAFLRQGRESLHQVRLSQLALACGDEEAAVRALCRAIEVDPTSVPARIALGFEYQSQGYHEEALVQFEVAARLQPDYPDVQYNLGLLYDAQGRSDEAVRCVRRALEVNPGYFQARMTLAQILLARERHDEAVQELEHLTRQGIRSADLCVQKAQAKLACDQLPEAVRELEEAIIINPSYARTYYVLGQAYRRLGLRRKARNAWQQYLESNRRWGEMQPAGSEEGENS